MSRRFADQVRTELLALRTVRTPWWLLAATVLATLVLAVTPVLQSGKGGAPSVGTAAAMLAVLGAAGRGSVVALLLGVVTVTGEFRHHTATATFLEAPQRARVLAGKAGCVALVAGAVAVIDLAVVLAVGLPSGAVRLPLLNGDILLRVLGLLLAYPAYAVLGVGIGALVGYQPLAVVLPLAWLLFLEDLVLHLLPGSFTPWSLFHVTAALANAGDVKALLPVAVGGLALLGYAVLLASAGTARVVRRDIL
jgi:ABC-2 type transport system permease protein